MKTQQQPKPPPQNREEHQSEMLEAMQELPGLQGQCWSPNPVGHFTLPSC